MLAWIYVLGGGIVLYFGAEWFVAGSARLALALRIPQLIVGLTVVAYGTSAPEVLVGAQAAWAGHGAVALGNVVGSNIVNIGLILGLAALLFPGQVPAGIGKREVPVLMGSAVLVVLLLLDGALQTWEALALVAGSVAYTYAMIRAALRAGSTASAAESLAEASRDADAAGAPAPTVDGAVQTAGAAERGDGAPDAVGSTWRTVATALGGLVGLLVGSTIFLRGAVDLAHQLGMSDRVVGLTIVAVGTSLPELVTSVIAARRGHAGLAIGNVVGSNIFNVTLCLGIAGLLGQINASVRSIAPELGAMIVLTFLAAWLVGRPRKQLRLEGAVLVATVVGFLAWTVARPVPAEGADGGGHEGGEFSLTDGDAPMSVAPAAQPATEAEIDLYVGKTARFMDRVLGIAEATAGDCTQMADAMEALFAESQPLLADIRHFDTRMTDAQKLTLGTRMSETQARFNARFPVAVAGCRQDPIASQRLAKTFGALGGGDVGAAPGAAAAPSQVAPGATPNPPPK